MSPTPYDRLARQMAAYRELPPSPAPYVMALQGKNHHSSVVNTDAFGHRLSRHGGKYIGAEHIASLKRVNVVIGGSTAFGVGAGSDAHTLPSLLAEHDGEPWVNLGIRAGNSFQENILILRHVLGGPIRQVVVFSGVNDCYLGLLGQADDEYDPLFQQEALLGGLEDGHLRRFSFKRRALSFCLSRLKGVRQKDIIHLPLWKMFSALPQPQAGARFLQNALDRLHSRFARNFSFYSGMNSVGLQVLFVLQPFFDWTGKEPSPEERDIFAFLESEQKDTMWSKMRNLLNDDFYRSVSASLSDLSKKYNVAFLDMNHLFQEETGFFFVDRVHLNDCGYNFCFKHIRRSLELKV